MPRQSDAWIDRPKDGCRRDLFAWTLAAAAVLVAALVAPCLFGYVYTHDDLGAYHLPLRAFYAGQLARGEAFDWTPQLFSGFYLTGEGQAGAYHPLHLVLYRFLPLQAAWACELVTIYPFMLAGTYFFLRRLLGRRDAAMFGSLAFTFSSFNLLHVVHPNGIAVVAHLPWLLWAIDVALSDANRHRAAAAQAGIALLTGSQILLGYPQYVWFSLLAEGAFVLYVTTQRGRLAGLAPRLPFRLGQLAIAKAAGVMLGGVQLLPTIEALAGSVRRSVDVAFQNSGSMHPLNLVQLVAPYLFRHRVVGENTHALAIYAGAVPLMLIVWLVACRRDPGRWRRPAWAVGCFGLVVLLLAFGRYGPIYGFQRLLPVVGGFRFPCRYAVLAALAVAVLSAIGLTVLARQQAGGKKMARQRLWPLWAVVGASAAAAVTGLVLRDRPFIGPVHLILIGPILISSAAVLVAFAARGSRSALVGLVLFAAADLGCYGMSYAVYRHTQRLDAYAASVTTPPGASGERVLVDLIGAGEPGLRTGNQLTCLGWRRVDGYAGLEPARKLDYGQLAALRAASVRWVMRTGAAEAIAGLRSYDEHWLEVPEPLERVRLVTQTQPSDDPARDVGRIPLESVALVDRPPRLSGGRPGVVRSVVERPGRFCVRVDGPGPQLLVISESYHAGWQAEVDGRPKQIVRANGDFLGCLVPPGEHEVVLEFRPRSLATGWVVTCFGLMVVAGLGVGHLVMCGPGRMAEVAEPAARERDDCLLHGEGRSLMSDRVMLDRRSMERVTLSVVLPVYNEQDVLATLLGRLVSSLTGCGVDYEIVFVDDGSSDASPEILDQLADEHASVRVVHLVRNFGHQAAIQSGLAHARGDAVVLMDSDMQDSPEAIPRLLEKWRLGYDVVYAIRARRKEGPVKRFLFAAFHRLLARVASIPIPADAGIFGLVDRRVAREIVALGERDRYFPGLRSWVGFRQTGVEVERNARYDGRPRVSLWGLVRLAKTAIFSFSTLPLRIFYVIGFLAATVFVGLGSYALFSKLFTDLAIPGWTSHILTGSFFGALNALGICILGEYVVRIYDQVRGRPLYLVDRTVNMQRRSRPQEPGAVDDAALIGLLEQVGDLLDAARASDQQAATSPGAEESIDAALVSAARRVGEP